MGAPSADPHPTPAGSLMRTDIQGLRAVAVLLVVLCHAQVGFLAGGFVGVDVFFVLSGFLITGVLLRRSAQRGRVSLADFYARRARRILPAATLTLVVTSVSSFHLLNFVRAKEYLVDALFAGVFAANVRFAEIGTDYFAQTQPPSPVQQFWTLAVEEQFYLVWPLLFTALAGVALARPGATDRSPDRRRLLLGVVVLGTVSFAWSVHATDTNPQTAYFSTFARAWELALGAALAIAAPRVAQMRKAVRLLAGWAGGAAIVAAAVAFDATTPFPGYQALLPVVGATLVIAAGIGVSKPGRHSIGRLLSLRPLTYVGDLSYALYLWHWPVLIIAAQAIGRPLSVATNLLLIGGAFVLSVVSFHLVEDPIRRGTWRPPSVRLWLWPAAAALAIVAVVQASGAQLSPPEKGAVLLVAAAVSLVGHRLFAGSRAEAIAGTRSSAWAIAVASVMVIAFGQRIDGGSAAAIVAGCAVAGGAVGHLIRGQAPSLEWQGVPGALVLWPVSIALVFGVAGYYLVRIGDAEHASGAAVARAAAPFAGAKSESQVALPAVERSAAAAQEGAPLPIRVRPPVAELLDDRFVFPVGCVAGTGETASEICRLGPAAGRTLVVLGDSKAHMWMPAILRLAKRASWSVVPLVKSSCTPYGWGSDPEDSECQTWKRWAIARVQELQPSLLVVAGHYEAFEVYPEFSDVSVRGLGGLLRAVIPAADREVLIGDIPGVEEEPVDCLLSNDSSMGTCATTMTHYQVAVAGRVERLARQLGVGFVDTEGWFCADLVCPIAVGRTLTYSDIGHVTKTYAHQLRRVFRQSLLSAATQSSNR